MKLLFSLVVFVSLTAAFTDPTRLDIESLFSFVETFDDYGYEELQTDSVACMNALQAWGAYAQGPAGMHCAGALKYVDPMTAGADPASAASNITFFCTPANNCSQDVLMLLSEVRNLCAGSTRMSIQAQFLAAQMMCLNDNTTGTPQLCLPPFQQFLGMAQMNMNNQSALTPAVLDQACTPCVAKSLVTWLRYERNVSNLLQIDQLRFLCLKRAGMYCLPIMMGIQALAPNITTNLSLTCHPCAYALVGKLEVRSVALGAFYAMANMTNMSRAELNNTMNYRGLRMTLNNMCSRDWNGGFCATKFGSINSDSVLSHCGAGIATGNCSEACRTFLQGLRDDLKCCTGTFLNVMQDRCDTLKLSNQTCPVTEDPALYRRGLQDYCQLIIPTPCGVAQRVIQIKYRLRNLDFNWCRTAGNIAMCLQFITNTLIYITGTNIVPLNVSTFVNYVFNASGAGYTDGNLIDTVIMYNASTDNVGAQDFAAATMNEPVPEALLFSADVESYKTVVAEPILLQDNTSTMNLTEQAQPADPPLHNVSSSTGGNSAGQHTPVFGLVAVIMVLCTVFAL